MIIIRIWHNWISRKVGLYVSNNCLCFSITTLTIPISQSGGWLSSPNAQIHLTGKVTFRLQMFLCEFYIVYYVGLNERWKWLVGWLDVDFLKLTWCIVFVVLNVNMNFKVLCRKMFPVDLPPVDETDLRSASEQYLLSLKSRPEDNDWFQSSKTSKVCTIMFSLYCGVPWFQGMYSVSVQSVGNNSKQHQMVAAIWGWPSQIFVIGTSPTWWSSSRCDDTFLHNNMRKKNMHMHTLLTFPALPLPSSGGLILAWKLVVCEWCHTDILQIKNWLASSNPSFIFLFYVICPYNTLILVMNSLGKSSIFCFNTIHLYFHSVFTTAAAITKSVEHKITIIQQITKDRNNSFYFSDHFYQFWGEEKKKLWVRKFIH